MKRLTNKNYKMLYLDIGHNDIDYEHKYDATNKTLSYTLNNPIQDRLIIDGYGGWGTETRRHRFSEVGDHILSPRCTPWFVSREHRLLHWVS